MSESRPLDSSKRRSPRWLFQFDGRVRPTEYLLAGVSLMALKYGVDAAVCYAATGRFWNPFDYIHPLFQDRHQEIGPVPTAVLVFQALWGLLFLWMGIALSSRRAVDAGRSPWLSLLFLVPVVNYLLMVFLVIAPTGPDRASRPPTGPDRAAPRRVEVGLLPRLLVGVMISGLLAALLVAVLAQALDSYGYALFLSTPFLIGAVAGYTINYAAVRSVGITIGAATMAVSIGCLAILLFALEGIVCIAMAFPLLWLAAVSGALVGRCFARLAFPPAKEAALAFIALPVAAAFSAPDPGAAPHEVLTAIEIDAPPEVVWPNVVSFSELPPPDDWLFETGIAYPLRARIVGVGEGAVRHCEFSTGAFVEPITAWEEPHRLAFSVVSQPPTMEEWSFYAHVHPPHLETVFRSVRGEFRLYRLDDGRTRLEGRTWYTLSMAPGPYWRLLADGIIHRIHQRVLAHVRALAEQ